MKIEGLMPIEPAQIVETIEMLSAKLAEAEIALKNSRKEEKELIAYKTTFLTLPCPAFNPMDQVDSWDTVTVGDVLNVYRRVSGVATPITIETIKLNSMPLSDFVARMRSFTA